MSGKIKRKGKGGAWIEVDDEKIDIARIMAQIKAKVARESGGRTMDTIPSVPESPTSSPSDDGAKKGIPGLRKRVKAIMLRLMKPFSPLIKLLILPVYEEQRQTTLILHEANKRLDHLYQKELPLIKENVRLMHNLCHNLVIELTKLKIELEMLKSKTRLMEKDFEHLGRRERALEKEIHK